MPAPRLPDGGAAACLAADAPRTTVPTPPAALAALSGLTLLLATIWQPPIVQRAGHWIGYRLTGHLPPPLLAGRNGRVFLANHPTDPPGSLSAQVCGVGLDAAAIGRAADALRPVLAAGKATGLPFRLLVVPTAARLYPEDLPRGHGLCRPGGRPAGRGAGRRALVYPVAAMEAMKPRFDVLPRRHFHWAGRGPAARGGAGGGRHGPAAHADLAVAPGQPRLRPERLLPGAGPAGPDRHAVPAARRRVAMRRQPGAARACRTRWSRSPGPARGASW